MICKKCLLCLLLLYPELLLSLAIALICFIWQVNKQILYIASALFLLCLYTCQNGQVSYSHFWKIDVILRVQSHRTIYIALFMEILTQYQFYLATAKDTNVLGISLLSVLKTQTKMFLSYAKKRNILQECSVEISHLTYYLIVVCKVSLVDQFFSVS